MRVVDDGVRVEYVALEELRGNPGNPKEHDVGEYTGSIGRHGFVTPGIVDERTGRLVKGHGGRDALMVMKASGVDAPGNVKVYLEEGREVWAMPIVRGMDFESDEEALAYLIADNRIPELGGWDDEKLMRGLTDLAVDGWLDGTGFSADELDEMMRDEFGDGFGEGEVGEGDEEGELSDAEEALGMWPVEEGVGYRVGEHKVICGDCRDKFLWEHLLVERNTTEDSNIEKVHRYAHGIITSPPYARQRRERFSGELGYGGVEEDQYVDWWGGVQANMMRFLADDGSFFLNIKPHTVAGERVLYVMDLVLAMRRSWEWKFIDEYSWTRTASPGSWPNRFKNGFEPVYHFGKVTGVKFRPDNVKGDEAGFFERHAQNENTGQYFNTNDTAFAWEGALPSNRVDIRENVANVGHEAAFPWKMPAFFIKAFSDEGDIWIDPFAGSGSSIVAAHKTGRIGLGIDIVPKNVALSVDRLANLTGETPKLL